MSSTPTYIKVANFSITHTRFSAVVAFYPDGFAQISERTGWTHDKSLDKAARDAARALAAEQKPLEVK